MKHEIFGVRIDDVDSSELETTVRSWISGTEARLIVTPNPEFLLAARQNSDLRDLLNSSDLSVADGVGIRFAIAALTDGRLRNRHTGVDLLERLARIASETGKRLVLVGGEYGEHELARAALKKRYPTLEVTAIDPGPVMGSAERVELSDASTQAMIASHPEILAVALGAGKQERLIRQLTPVLPNLRVAIGVGGAFNMIGGRRRRAPVLLRRIGLEWVWRLLIEPKRGKRIARAVIRFPIAVALSTLKSRRFLRACRNVFPEIVRQLRGL